MTFPIDLLASYDAYGVLGELTGISLAERDRRQRRVVRAARGRLAAAREEAAADGNVVTVDASAVSGIAGGDAWLVAPDGAVERRLEPAPVAAEVIGRRAAPTSSGAPPVSPAEARPLLLRCAYNGLWSPSGTNWQPIRVVEVAGEELATLAAAAGWRPVGDAVAVVVRRTAYESLLGDVAALGGAAIEARAELVDAGIHRAACAVTVAGHGCDPGWLEVPDDRRTAADSVLGAIVRRRVAAWGEAAAELTQRLEVGGATVAWGFEPRPLAGDGRHLTPGIPGGLAPSAVDRLVWSRASERVASPSRELEPDRVRSLLARARAAAPDAAEAVEAVVLSRGGPEVAAIGRAVHEALYGAGADPTTGAGGAGGLLSRISEPVVAAGLGLADTAPGTPVPMAAVPRRLRDHLLASPGIGCDGELLVERDGRPLTVAGLTRLVRVLTVGFGRHFLGFGSTHPVTVVLLAPLSPLVPDVGFACGELVARLLLLARADGLVAVAKSGPTELARDAIDRVVAAAAPRLEGRIANGALGALLVVQLGWPLGPDEQVVVGGEPHDGLVERLHDRRAPRARLAEHYLPGLGAR